MAAYRGVVASVYGVDGARAGSKSGWIAVEADAGGLRGMAFQRTFQGVLDAAEEAGVVAVGVDIPIGHEGTGADDPDGTRLADREARRFLGGSAASSIFFLPPREVLAADEYDEACRRARARGWNAPSKQVWMLRERVIEVEAALDEGGKTPEVREVHPEVSFVAMARLAGRQTPLPYPKRSWNGLVERLELLHAVGLRPRRAFGGIGKVGADDVLDATAAAWSARRIAAGEAESIPSDPPRDPTSGRRVAIWY